MSDPETPVPGRLPPAPSAGEPGHCLDASSRSIHPVGQQREGGPCWDPESKGLRAREEPKPRRERAGGPHAGPGRRPRAGGVVPNGAGPPARTRPALRARRGAVAGRFTSSLRTIFGRVSMHLPLPPPPLLLLLAAVAAATTTFRPDWNRLQGLARARVEVSAAAPQPTDHRP